MGKSDSNSLLQNLLKLLTRILQTLKNYPQSWRSWWASRTLTERFLPLALIGVYWFVLLLIQGFRNDHLVVGITILALAYLGKNGREFLKFGLPFFLTGIVYDSQRFYADYIRGPIHVREPYDFDKHFFGIQTAQGILTPNEWWQFHIHPVLDIITGFAYLVFFAVFIVLSAYFYFYLKVKGTKKCSPAKLAAQAPRMPWAFFWLNVIGYSTYYWYAAAPPWYVSMYGLGPAQMDVPANSAGCVRFDQILGTHFFSEMYGRAADVFGAIPSLHVAYPLLAILFAFQFGAARTFSICFYVIMCFSAVYLNHHYVLDILWGSAYAITVGVLINIYYDARDRKKARLHPNHGSHQHSTPPHKKRKS